ncbi:MAG TPA: polysaccharide deacetylase family protein [Cyclobacteriaceae bacterium]
MKLVVALLLLSFPLYAQKWNGHKAAVVLTYDDALNVHLDNVIPSLDSAGLSGTFYLTVSSAAFTKRMEEWKRASINGHELGNHTMYHPCVGGTPDRSWVKPEYDLNNYTLRRIEDEIRMTNILLQIVDGKTERTFAYPCADTKAGGQSYIDAITGDFVGARGVRDEIIPFGKADVYNTACFSMVNASADKMIGLVKKGIKESGLVVFLFHGVGGEHGLNVDLKEHQELIHFLKQNQRDIWVAPFIDVVKFLKSSQK